MAIPRSIIFIAKAIACLVLLVDSSDLPQNKPEVFQLLFTPNTAPELPVKQPPICYGQPDKSDQSGWHAVN